MSTKPKKSKVKKDRLTKAGEKVADAAESAVRAGANAFLDLVEGVFNSVNPSSS